MSGQLSAVWGFVADRWTTAAEPDPGLVMVLTLGVLVLACVPRVWRVVRQASTIIHEMGHVLAAWVSGRRVSGIKLHSDTSGVTVSRGRSQGPGILFTMVAGYPAPGLLALGLVLLSTTGYAGAALTVYQAVLVLALLLSRNVVGVVSCVLSLLVTGGVWWWDNPSAVTYTVVALSVFYAVAGVRGSLDVIRMHVSRREDSSATDAAQAAVAWKAVPLPAGVWLGLFLLVSLVSAVGVLWLLLAEGLM